MGKLKMVLALVFAVRSNGSPDEIDTPQNLRPYYLIQWSADPRNHFGSFRLNHTDVIIQSWPKIPDKMKMLSHALILIILALILPSCGDSCSHCMVKDGNDNVIKDYDEKCGTSDDVDEYERSAAEDAAQYSGGFSCDH
ncbi:MAG: hypothetical protein K9J06_11100 [Flavobacteriales bacterium]|nr:hypothetical protein [Flavobacteriales bacterium]